MISTRTRSRGLSLLTLLLATALFAGCDLLGFGCGDEERPEYDADYGGGEGIDVGSLTYQTFALFQSLDIPSQIGPEVETGLFDRTAREITIEGSPVFFLEYETEEEARAVASTIAPDGRRIAEKSVPSRGIMKGTPHFYRTGKVIGIYFGDRERTLEALETVLGEQFAGGTGGTGSVDDAREEQSAEDGPSIE